MPSTAAAMRIMIVGQVLGGMLLGAVAKKKDLQMEGPLTHVSVKISQVRIISHRLIAGTPAQPAAQHDAPADGAGQHLQQQPVAAFEEVLARNDHQ